MSLPPKLGRLSSPLKKPGFPKVFAYWANCFGFPAYLCMSVPSGAAPGEIIVSCAALEPGASLCESPESSPKPRFSRGKMLFYSGCAGFELGKFES